ncbi:hypothetical protein BQ8794_280061 [Mesorhizobium prunaredense]|uniref:Uncharacterized protein n=1 Tax=Mesorhizobium prunaredense TaxID=1631249 RepID=A0A1R3V8U6_9HYPH|nr:hypothetical protein BQ8794_280061 [Mesorhizobium prunaredense]
MAIEQKCPAGVLPSEEAVLLLYFPNPSTRNYGDSALFAPSLLGCRCD